MIRHFQAVRSRAVPMIAKRGGRYITKGGSHVVLDLGGTGCHVQDQKTRRPALTNRTALFFSG
jgi:hypothetical protein